MTLLNNMCCVDDVELGWDPGWLVGSGCELKLEV